MEYEYNRALCDERHLHIKIDVDRAHQKISRISDSIVRFYIFIIATLVSVLLNLAVTVFKFNQ